MLTQIDDVEEEKMKPGFINHRRDLYHRVWDIILRSILESAKLGSAMLCADGVTRVFHILVKIVSADFEEQ